MMHILIIFIPVFPYLNLISSDQMTSYTLV